MRSLGGLECQLNSVTRIVRRELIISCRFRPVLNWRLRFGSGESEELVIGCFRRFKSCFLDLPLESPHFFSPVCVGTLLSTVAVMRLTFELLEPTLRSERPKNFSAIRLRSSAHSFQRLIHSEHLSMRLGARCSKALWDVSHTGYPIRVSLTHDIWPCSSKRASSGKAMSFDLIAVSTQVGGGAIELTKQTRRKAGL